jgi:hypothetical protein
MQTSILQRTVNRRTFLRNSAIATVGAALAQATLSTQVVRAAAPSRNVAAHEAQASMDLDILNYALTLEHLEDRAYRAAIGTGLLSGTALDYFRSFGSHEAAHVSALTQTIRDLGGTPVNAQAGYNFPDFGSQQEILEYFQTVEELGAAAYLGQAPRIQNPDLLTAAVSIHNVEAQHAAALSDLIGVAPAPAFATPKTMEEVMMVVTPILMPAAQMPMAMPATGRGGDAPRYGAMQAE